MFVITSCVVRDEQGSVAAGRHAGQWGRQTHTQQLPHSEVWVALEGSANESLKEEPVPGFDQWTSMGVSTGP